MSAFTDDDLAEVARVIHAETCDCGSVGAASIRKARNALEGVAPAIAARAVRQAEERWAAEVTETKRLLHERARARAEGVES